MGGRHHRAPRVGTAATAGAPLSLGTVTARGGGLACSVRRGLGVRAVRGGWPEGGGLRGLCGMWLLGCQQHK